MKKKHLSEIQKLLQGEESKSANEGSNKLGSRRSAVVAALTNAGYEISNLDNLADEQVKPALEIVTKTIAEQVEKDLKDKEKANPCTFDKLARFTMHKPAPIANPAPSASFSSSPSLEKLLD